MKTSIEWKLERPNVLVTKTSTFTCEAEFPASKMGSPRARERMTDKMFHGLIGGTPEAFAQNALACGAIAVTTH